MKHYLEPVGEFPPKGKNDALFLSSGRPELKISGILALVLAGACLCAAQPPTVATKVGWAAMFVGVVVLAMSMMTWEVRFKADEQVVSISWKIFRFPFFRRSVLFRDVDFQFRVLAIAPRYVTAHNWFAMRVARREFFFLLPESIVISEAKLPSFKRKLGFKDPPKHSLPNKSL